MYKSSYTGSQIDEAVAKANAAAPQSTTYTKTRLTPRFLVRQTPPISARLPQRDLMRHLRPAIPTMRCRRMGCIRL